MSLILYLWLWGAYLILVLLGLIGAWRVSRRWPLWLAWLGRTLLAVILLVPAPQAPGSSWFAPALVAAIFDQIQGLEQGWFRAGVYLMAGVTLALLIYLVQIAWYLLRRRKVKGD